MQKAHQQPNRSPETLLSRNLNPHLSLSLILKVHEVAVGSVGHPLVLVPGSSGDHGAALFYPIHPGLGWTQGGQMPGGVLYGPVVG